MGNIDWVLEAALVGLLVVTLVHAIRLERALQSLRQDRSALGDAIAGFDSSAKQAEAGVGRLQSAAAESAHLLGQRLEHAVSLKDDLQLLVDRGEAVADRLDGLVRTGRGIGAAPSPTLTQAAPPVIVPKPISAPQPVRSEPMPKVRSQAERDLLLALRAAQ